MIVINKLASTTTDNVLKENGYDSNYRAQGAGQVREGSVGGSPSINYVPYVVIGVFTFLVLISALLITILIVIKKK